MPRINLLDEGGRSLIGEVFVLDDPFEEIDLAPLDHRHEQAGPQVRQLLLAHLPCVCFVNIALLLV